MGLLFYYIPRSQTTPPGVIHLYTIQTAKIWSLHLENTKSLWKKLIESEKNYQNIRITLAIREMGLSFHYIPRFLTIRSGMAHLDTIQTAKIWCLQLEDSESLLKKSTEAKKIIKILE